MIMKLQCICFAFLFLVSIALAQEYRCIEGTLCDPDRLRNIADTAETRLTNIVNRRLAILMARLEATQSRIRDVINSDILKNSLTDELEGDIVEFREGASELICDVIQYLTNRTESIRDSITKYTRTISFSYLEMIFDRIQNSIRFQDLITAIREAKQCVLDNLNERGFMNTTNAVSGVISSSRDSIDRIASLTRTALSDLTPVKDKLSDIIANFRPISSCLQVYSTSLGCRLCQLPDDQITTASPCFEFCGQTITYCVSVIRGALPGVRDVVRIIKLISDALEKGTIQDRFRDTLVSFSSLVNAIEQLGENVFSFLKDFDIADFIRDVANECFPRIVESVQELFDEFRSAIRNALTTLRIAIQEAIDNVKEGITDIIDTIGGLFDRRRRQVDTNEIPLLDEVLLEIVNEFCDELSSTSEDVCWNGTDIAPYNPSTTADFTVSSQADNPAVRYAGVNPSTAVNRAQAEVAALSSNSPSSTAVCESLTQSGGNITVYNELSTSDEVCFSELNGATLLASSVFMVLSLSILVLHSLYVF
ncbi:hypothetical protein LOD99_14048 [Oopsacas minuta]|uniref:Uncharacterized protein n=1 Tax=Oopsacas minuta TaxID=111878 RepID=A0AAV7KGN9_9METZ|nr:hypothetical protein LOD99_14048 [Oopsacas minuta]